jgi:hypothetical protein
MVVVSGIWVKNVATYPTPAINDMVISNENKMTAKAVLICRPNSHPFQERTLALDQPVKVGRSVARARATRHQRHIRLQSALSPPCLALVRERQVLSAGRSAPP